MQQQNCGSCDHALSCLLASESSLSLGLFGDLQLDHRRTLPGKKCRCCRALSMQASFHEQGLAHSSSSASTCGIASCVAAYPSRNTGVLLLPFAAVDICCCLFTRAGLAKPLVLCACIVSAVVLLQIADQPQVGKRTPHLSYKI